MSLSCIGLSTLFGRPCTSVLNNGYWGRVLCPALSFSVSFCMIRLLPKIMMLASSAVISSVPSSVPGDWYKEISDNLSQGVSLGIVTSHPGNYDTYILVIRSGQITLPCVVDSFEFSTQYWGVSDVWDYGFKDSESNLYVWEGMSLIKWFVDNDVTGVTLDCIAFWKDGTDGNFGDIDASSLVDHFVIDGTFDFEFEPGNIVTISKVVGFDAVPVYSIGGSGEDSHLLFYPLYQADYSESASDVFGVVSDAIGEMGSGLADGVEEATALFYADGSFTTLGILTLLTCGVALVFWAFYLIRKYLHVGVK